MSTMNDTTRIGATANIGPTTHIWVASIEHRHGANLYAAHTSADLDRQIAAFAREYWTERFPCAQHREAEALSDADAMRIYFDEHPDESVTIGEVPLAGERLA